jgi:hypothetical protein
MASSGITGGTLLGVVALSDGEQEKVFVWQRFGLDPIIRLNYWKTPMKCENHLERF